MRSCLSVLITIVCLGFCRSSPEQSEECSYNHITRSINDFSFQLIKKIGGTDNLFISPLSIYMALSLVYLGACGETARQFEKVLGLHSSSLTDRQFHYDLQKIVNSIMSGNEGNNLIIANGIFLQQNFFLKPSFVEEAGLFYQACVKQIDFFSDPAGATEEINQWAAKKTHNKIKNFLQQPLDRSTLFTLLNAVYFKGIWETTFNPRASFEDLFYRNSTTNKTVKFMLHRYKEFGYFEDPITRHKFLELPYKGGNIGFLVALPLSSADGLNVEMTSTMLCRIDNSLTLVKIAEVILPSFKLDYRQDLKDILKQLGIKDVFTTSADLSRMNEQGVVYVSEILHSSAIEVDEEGTTAAAVTSVISLGSSLEGKKTFVANRPFMFYIIDRKNNIILFAGRVDDPQ